MRSTTRPSRLRSFPVTTSFTRAVCAPGSSGSRRAPPVAHRSYVSTSRHLHLLQVNQQRLRLLQLLPSLRKHHPLHSLTPTWTRCITLSTWPLISTSITCRTLSTPITSSCRNHHRHHSTSIPRICLFHLLVRLFSCSFCLPYSSVILGKCPVLCLHSWHWRVF